MSFSNQQHEKIALYGFMGSHNRPFQQFFVRFFLRSWGTRSAEKVENGAKKKEIIQVFVFILHFLGVIQNVFLPDVQSSRK